MVEAQDSEFEPYLDHSVVLLGKTLYAHSAFLHPPPPQEYKLIPIGGRGITRDGLASHPGQVAKILVTSCYQN